MSTIKDQYVSLVSLTQLYLLENYQRQEKIFVDRSAISEFKAAVPVPQAKKPVAIEPPPSLPGKQVPKEPPAFVAPPPPVPQPVAAPPSIVAAPPAPKVEAPAKAFFKLEPLDKPHHVEFSDLKSVMGEKFPHYKILDSIPSDREALLKKYPVAQEVTLLLFQESDKHRLFLNNLSQAIATLGFQTGVIATSKLEKENDWENFLSNDKMLLIIASDYAIYSMPNLMKFYKQAPKAGRQFLGKVPLFLLSDISFYFKEPSLKVSLWKAVKDLLLHKKI